MVNGDVVRDCFVTADHSPFAIHHSLFTIHHLPGFWMSTILFIIFAGLAIGCAIAMVSQSNPLYSAISLIGVFISLASIYVTLAAPFIAAVQVIVYAGAIMVLVIFVIMLLNVEQSEPRRKRLRFLVPVALVMAAILIAETAFILYSVQTSENTATNNISDVGLTHSIGQGLFTGYLLPFEVTSVLLLMAIVGAMSLARREAVLSPTARVVPGAQVLAMDIVNPRAVGNQTPVVTETSDQAARLLGVEFQPEQDQEE
jgi:NADH-quinone oxidoreductase subunit J